MTLHPQAERLVALMASRQQKSFSEQTPQEARAARATTDYKSDEHVHEMREVNALGVRCRLYKPHEGNDMGLLVFLHGGGWVIGSLESHDGVCRSLANQSGHAVLAVEYRLAPEDPFPAGLEDCIRATLWAHQNAGDLGIDPTRIAVGGDSAGGNLAAVVAQLQPVPLVFQALIYPVTDGTCDRPSMTENAEGYLLSRNAMDWFHEHYTVTVEDLSDPRYSPIFSDLAGAPPAVVVTAGFDPLRDQGNAYAAKLVEAGVDVDHMEYAGMFHGFFSMDAGLNVASEAQDQVAAALKDAFAQ